MANVYRKRRFTSSRAKKRKVGGKVVRYAVMKKVGRSSVMVSRHIYKKNALKACKRYVGRCFVRKIA